MKSLFSLLFLLLNSAVVMAATDKVPDEAVVKEMARQTNIPEEYIREDFNACDSVRTPKIMICLRYNLVEEDVRLNRIYKQARATAKEIGFESSLVEAQRAWVAFRDAHCQYEGFWGAGFGREQGMYKLTCMRELTRQRADHLETRINREN